MLNVELKTLQVDPAYQRQLRPMKAAYNPQIVGSLLVGKRPDGAQFIIDGQHRRELAMRSGVLTLPATVIETSGPKEEARLHIEANAHRGQTSREMFKSMITAEDPETLQMIGLVNSVGLSIGDSKELRCINTVRAAFKRNKTALRRALLVTKKTWDSGVYNRFEQRVFSAMVYVFDNCPNIDENRFIRLVGRHKPDFYASGFSGGSQHIAIARNIIDTYNNGKTKLKPDSPKFAKL